jgi:tRNA dimethylallyltransferase
MKLADRIGGEIVSVDSMQVYKGMDVGTAKPTHLERNRIRHHLIDLVDPDVDFSVAEFSRVGRRVLEERDVPLVISGGSGLHFRSLVDPMSFAPTDPELRAELERRDLEDLREDLLAIDEDAANHVDLRNKRRVVRSLEIARLGAGTPSSRYASVEARRLRNYDSDYEIRAFGLDPGDRLEHLVAERLAQMRAGGLIEEVRGLVGRMGRTARAAIGYREVLAALAGRVEMGEAFTQIESNTMSLARRQRTWFQRDPRVQWIPWSDDADGLADRIEQELE